jgi:hypothetical protein
MQIRFRVSSQFGHPVIGVPAPPATFHFLQFRLFYSWPNKKGRSQSLGLPTIALIPGPVVFTMNTAFCVHALLKSRIDPEFQF